MALVCVLIADGLTASPANAAFPGRNGRLAVTTGDCSNYGCSGSVETVLASGRGKRELFYGKDFGGVGTPGSLAYSPGGRWIAFAAGQGASEGIRRMRANGRSGTSLLALGSDPDWSPDGRRVVFAGAPGLQILTLGSSESSVLTAGTEPAWSVRGLIAFTKARNMGTDPERMNENKLDIYVIRPDGSGLRRVVAGSQPEWSPDGKRIVFTTPRSNIATARADGTALRLVTRTPDQVDSSPSFSPRGRRIAFVRSSDGEAAKLYVTGPGGRGARRIFSHARCLFCAIKDIDWQPLPPRRKPK